ncbi:aspartyl/asparaginyl beta-hydroxylase isoform X2 [Amia ocellicauda]|uniref:aspartyl/asparaginyl beta-hydroxylase isoform X2 n=1 Tax=Amia ocellicauda TaxID=2972642 RepID=UPI0034640E26
MGETNDMAEDTDGKHIGNKNGKKGEGLTGSSFFTWFMVIALLGVWTSVAVVWFDLVDYEEVLARAKDFRSNISEVLQGKLGVYDADGDGDFDVEDAKVLLGLKEKPIAVESRSLGEDEVAQPPEETVPEPELVMEEEIQASVAEQDSEPPPDEAEEEQEPEEEVAGDTEIEQEEEEEQEQVLEQEAVAEEFQAEEEVELWDELQDTEELAEREREEEEQPYEVEEEDSVEEEDIVEEELPLVDDNTEYAPEEEERLEKDAPVAEEERMEAGVEEEEEEEEAAEAPVEDEADVSLEEEGTEEVEELAAPVEEEMVEETVPETHEEPEVKTEELDEAVEADGEEDQGDQNEPSVEVEEESYQTEEAPVEDATSEPEEEEETPPAEEEYSDPEKSEYQDQQFEGEESPSEEYSEDVQDASSVSESEDEVYGSQSMDVESEIQAAVPLPEPEEEDFSLEEDTPEDTIDTQGESVLDTEPEHGEEESRDAEESMLSEPELSEEDAEPQELTTEDISEPEPDIHSEVNAEDHDNEESAPEEAVQTEEATGAEQHIQEEPSEAVEPQGEEKPKEKAKKKKKPKLLNKFDKTIKAEIDAAEKLRKKGKAEEALQAFESLVSKYPQSPRALYGKAQAEDDLAEKKRSNEVLQRAINTFRDAADLPGAPADLVKLALKRRAERQQFLGRMRGALVTLEKLVQLFPEDISLKNDLGVGFLLLGDNKNAKKVYEEVLSIVPNDGFAKVHYGFILKAENKIVESIPYLREGLESGDPGTDDGRFYFHLGDALQRVGDSNAYKWYEIGHQRGHFASVWQRSLYNVNGLKAQAWWTAKETGYTDLVKTLERNWKMIRDEALTIMDSESGLFAAEDENLRERGEWGQFTLWQQGKKTEKSCLKVPKTCALLDRFPEATGCRRGQIKYSVMQPGTHVWPHTGPTNCRLRMHLGLVVPREGCKIRCANDTRFWEEGKVLVFDDSFEHEVWQDADSYRLIFIVDVWHPELTPYQRQTLSPI